MGLKSVESGIETEQLLNTVQFGETSWSLHLPCKPEIEGKAAVDRGGLFNKNNSGAADAFIMQIKTCNSSAHAA